MCNHLSVHTHTYTYTPHTLTWIPTWPTWPCGHQWIWARAVCVAQCFAVETVSVSFFLAVWESLRFMSWKCKFSPVFLVVNVISLFCFQWKGIFSFQMFQVYLFFLLYQWCFLFPFCLGAATITFSKRLLCCALKLPVIIFTAQVSCQPLFM